MTKNRSWIHWGCWPVLATTLVWGCANDPAPVAPAVGQPPSDPEIVAIYGDGQTVTRADVDRAVLVLPAAERVPAADQTATEWHESLVRELVLDRLLADQEIDVSSDAELAAARDEIQRLAMVEVYLERNLPPISAVTEAEARAFHATHAEQFHRPARRLVSHLFKRRAEGQPVAPLKQTVDALRQRIVAGESFGLLAAEHSDSESRHREGVLGWQTKESLPPELSTVVFALPAHEPSAPIPTEDGVHLFWVDQAVEARSFRFEEVALLIRRKLEEERRQESLLKLVARLPMPGDSFVPGGEELAQILAAKDPRALVLRMGAYELRAARFRVLLATSFEHAPQRASATVAVDFLAALARRERTYQQAVAEGVDQEPAVAERVRQLERRSLLDALRRRELERKLSREPEHLQAYYDNNAPRFSSPLRLEIQRLAIPVTADNRNRIMGTLESVAHADARAAPADLEALATGHGGSLEDLGWMTLAEIGRVDHRLISLVADLQPGQVTAPYRDEDVLALVAVTDRREPEPQPMAMILPRLRKAYLQDHGQAIYRQWADETLESADLTILRDRLGQAPR